MIFFFSLCGESRMRENGARKCGAGKERERERGGKGLRCVNGDD